MTIASAGILWLAVMAGILLDHYCGPFWPTVGATFAVLWLTCVELYGLMK